MYNDLPQTLKSTFFKILSSLPAGTYGAGLKKMILVFEANNVASLKFNFFFGFQSTVHRPSSTLNNTISTRQLATTPPKIGSQLIE